MGEAAMSSPQPSGAFHSVSTSLPVGFRVGPVQCVDIRKESGNTGLLLVLNGTHPFVSIGA